MYDIFTYIIYIWLTFMVHVGKYTIHGSYGTCLHGWGFALYEGRWREIKGSLKQIEKKTRKPCVNTNMIMIWLSRADENPLSVAKISPYSPLVAYRHPTISQLQTLKHPDTMGDLRGKVKWDLLTISWDTASPTVDEGNPAPVHRWFIPLFPLFTVFYTSQVLSRISSINSSSCKMALYGWSQGPPKSL